jgi:hypothetical protein
MQILVKNVNFAIPCRAPVPMCGTVIHCLRYAVGGMAVVRAVETREV